MQRSWRGWAREGVHITPFPGSWVQSSTQKIFTQCLAKGYVSSQEGSHFEGFAWNIHSVIIVWVGNVMTPWNGGRTREDFESTVLFTSFAKCLCLRAEMMISQPANLEIWGQVLCFFCLYNQRTLGNFGIDQKLRGISTRMSTMQTTFLSTNFQGSFPPQYTHVFCPTINMLSCWFVSWNRREDRCFKSRQMQSHMFWSVDLPLPPKSLTAPPWKVTKTQ